MDSAAGLPAVDYAATLATRDCLQDIAKVIGKAQQLFLESDPHDYQRGLIVTEYGFASQALTVNNTVCQIECHYGQKNRRFWR